MAQNEKKLHGFSYVKSIANFEGFHWNFSLSTNPQIIRSDVGTLKHIFAAQSDLVDCLLI